MLKQTRPKSALTKRPEPKSSALAKRPEPIIAPPTKTEAGFVKSKVLAMYCHADKRNYKKLADKLKGLFLKKEKTLYEDTGEEYNLDSILDDVCSYLGLEGSYLGLEGGRRNKTKTSKYKKRKTNKSKKSRKHIRSRRLSRSRRPVKSRRYKKSRK